MSKIICLWSCPRNVSTALMYSFAQRNDTDVFDEPLYAHYLRVSGSEHPGRNEIMNSLENDGDRVVKEVILQESNKILFHKLMTHFLIDINTAFLSLVKNIIFIRDPEEIISSYDKVIPNPTMNDIGIKKQYDLYLFLEKSGCAPVVLDSKNLLKAPELILRKLCSILGIDFHDCMLKWEEGPIKEDGVWAKYWYANTHRSTGFLPFARQENKLTKNNAELAKMSLPYYNFLTSKSI